MVKDNLNFEATAASLLHAIMQYTILIVGPDTAYDTTLRNILCFSPQI